LGGIGGFDGNGTVGRLKAESKSSIKKLLLIVVAIFMFGFQSSDNRCSSTFFSLVCLSMVMLVTRISITNCKQSQREKKTGEKKFHW
jgi:uncharacterized membrane protein YhaH (DUF805 family)